MDDIEDVRCPKCNSEDFSERTIEPTGFAEYVIIIYQCNICNTNFQVEYRAVKITIIGHEENK